MDTTLHSYLSVFNIVHSWAFYHQVQLVDRGIKMAAGLYQNVKEKLCEMQFALYAVLF